MNIRTLNKKLKKISNGTIYCVEEDNTRFVKGETSSYYKVLESCFLAVSKKKGMHVVNDINFLNEEAKKVRIPTIVDDELEGYRCDCLVIGGGISGATILRELSRYNLKCLLVEKESDLACQTSSRNDGEIHPGVDLPKGTLKQKYVVRGNKMYDELCKDLSVPFVRCGQVVGFTEGFLRPFIGGIVTNRKNHCGVKDTELVEPEFLKKLDSEFNPNIKFAIYNKSAGVTSPYELTIACAENAVENGNEVMLNTYVSGMEVVDGKIVSVKTNRGTIYPKLVINAAGVFAEEIAKMANDHFYSIHGRKGTILITDKKANYHTSIISSVKTTKTDKKKMNSKGGGSMRTVHGNLLLGPDAEETFLKEDYSVTNTSIDKIIRKQEMTIPTIKKSDIITYFAGVRACTFEEDYIIEKGRKTSNLIHVAGIQSPGLTTAPAVAVDVVKMAVEMIGGKDGVALNQRFNPIRKVKPILKDLSFEERNYLIKENPDYGLIVCRCEEISKGEITDCLERPIVVPTIDGIKRRIRPGMGRCQGGFCMPLVASIIAEHEKIKLSDVEKSNEFNKIGVNK